MCLGYRWVAQFLCFLHEGILLSGTVFSDVILRVGGGWWSYEEWEVYIKN